MVFCNFPKSLASKKIIFQFFIIIAYEKLIYYNF